MFYKKVGETDWVRTIKRIVAISARYHGNRLEGIGYHGFAERPYSTLEKTPIHNDEQDMDHFRSDLF